MDGKTCRILNSHLAIVSSQGTIQPCCQARRYSSKPPHEPLWFDIFNESINDLNDVLKSSLWRDLDSRLQSGEKHSACDSCWSAENAGLTSRRLYFNERLPHTTINKIRDLEIGLDYVCNMICRSCSSGYSSAWAGADKLLKSLSDFGDYRYTGEFRNKHFVTYPKRIRELITQTDLSELTSLRIVGGEPFYSKNMAWFLDHLCTKYDSRKISLYFNTNGSLFPEPEIIALLQRFKKVSLEVSVDAVGDLAEVLRPPTSWGLIDENFKKWLGERTEVLDIGVHTTISAMNYNQLLPLLKWVYSHPKVFETKAILTEPRFFSPWQLPLPFRDQLLFREAENPLLEIIRGYYESREMQPVMAKEFMQVIGAMDHYHGKKFCDVNPEIYEIFEGMIDA